eukprot:scaffold1252_cov124-Isochrysis_galbana.AAC.10
MPHAGLPHAPTEIGPGGGGGSIARIVANLDTEDTRHSAHSYLSRRPAWPLACRSADAPPTQLPPTRAGGRTRASGRGGRGAEIDYRNHPRPAASVAPARLILHALGERTPRGKRGRGAQSRKPAPSETPLNHALGAIGPVGGTAEAPNSCTVTCLYTWPRRRTVLGKCGWLGESGKCCVSKQKPVHPSATVRFPHAGARAQSVGRVGGRGEHVVVVVTAAVVGPLEPGPDGDWFRQVHGPGDGFDLAGGDGAGVDGRVEGGGELDAVDVSRSVAQRLVLYFERGGGRERIGHLGEEHAGVALVAVVGPHCQCDRGVGLRLADPVPLVEAPFAPMQVVEAVVGRERVRLAIQSKLAPGDAVGVPPGNTTKVRAGACGSRRGVSAREPRAVSAGHAHRPSKG